MPYATADGVRLYYEETGSDLPVIFVHEFAGDYRSWEPQVRFFSRRYRCITFNARGYPPSDVPEDPAAYSQAIAADDIAHVLGHLKIAQAHVVGLSMGGFATLHFGLRHPEMARSLVVAGCGYGSVAEQRQQFQADAEALAQRLETLGMAAVGETYALGPYRVQFQAKDPRGWAEFARMLAEHSAKGSALTMRGVQKLRPSVWELEAQLRKLTIPTLIVTGDEDEPCLEPNLFLKRAIPTAGLWVVPKTGHTANLEEPDLFNRTLQDFLDLVEAGRWPARDPRSLAKSALLWEPRAPTPSPR
ncbi:MAG: alpha/beta hydrolase [Candidatus Rokubacteria bacterium]|nr:alpha/beta hydrolase [Candidatus Rokubacteria bacterium]